MRRTPAVNSNTPPATQNYAQLLDYVTTSNYLSCALLASRLLLFNVWLRNSLKPLPPHKGTELNAMKTDKNALIFPPIWALSYFSGHMTRKSDFWKWCMQRSILLYITTKAYGWYNQTNQELSLFPHWHWKRNDTNQRERFVIEYIVFFWPCLEGHRLTIRVGLDTFKWILNLAGWTSRTARWHIR